MTSQTSTPRPIKVIGHRHPDTDSMSNHSFRRSTERRVAVAVTFMPTGVDARWRTWASAPTVVMPSSRYSWASSRAHISINASMLGVERILAPAVPTRLAVMVSSTVQVRLC